MTTASDARARNIFSSVWSNRFIISAMVQGAVIRGSRWPLYLHRYYNLWNKHHHLFVHSRYQIQRDSVMWPMCIPALRSSINLCQTVIPLWWKKIILWMKLKRAQQPRQKKITPAWDVAVRSAPKHQTMSKSFLLCASAGTLTGLSEDTSVAAAVKRQLCTGTPKSTSTVIMRQ